MEDIDIIEVLDIHRMRKSTQYNDRIADAMICEEQARDDRIAEIMAKFLCKHTEQGEREYIPDGIDWVTWLSMQN